jgi:(S)-2-hydroxyglutarate dehydrogenase
VEKVACRWGEANSAGYTHRSYGPRPEPDHRPAEQAVATLAARFDVVVGGGGIVGLATALALTERHRLGVAVLEAEERLAAHQTGHNSGVIHSGLYYPPGSAKARLCAAGREALYRFLDEEGLPYRRSGKLVVAVTAEELPRLDELERRGHANGLAGLRRLGAGEIREREPHAAGVAALWVEETGLVDFAAVAARIADRLRAAGGEVLTGARVTGVARERTGGGLTIETPRGAFAAGGLVNCAGLQADRVARLCGLAPDVRIIPFRGDYYALVAGRRELVRHPIYPVPDPAFPFLGVHFTPHLDGGVEVGPNAVPALARQRYRRGAFSLRDAAETLAWPGFWRLAGRHAATGAAEIGRSLSRAAFARAAARLVPEVGPADLVAAGCGIRAQAVDRRGRLVDDFRFLTGERTVHVLNAPSPAATAALAIGEEIAATAVAALALRPTGSPPPPAS